jgi:hypothetical protein
MKNFDFFVIKGYCQAETIITTILTFGKTWNFKKKKIIKMGFRERIYF